MNFTFYVSLLLQMQNHKFGQFGLIDSEKLEMFKSSWQMLRKQYAMTDNIG